MANRHDQKYGQSAVERRLRGIKSSGGMLGILGRGKTLYLGGSSTPQRGTELDLGRPKGAKDKVPGKSSIQRRLGQRKGL
jgi:hypothetical protein